MVLSKAKRKYSFSVLGRNLFNVLPLQNTNNYLLPPLSFLSFTTLGIVIR